MTATRPAPVPQVETFGAATVTVWPHSDAQLPVRGSLVLDVAQNETDEATDLPVVFDQPYRFDRDNVLIMGCGDLTLGARNWNAAVRWLADHGLMMAGLDTCGDGYDHDPIYRDERSEVWAIVPQPDC